MRTAAVVLAGFATSTAIAEPLRVDATLGLTHFQQQVKPEIGAPRGERLVEHNALTVGAIVSYPLHRHVAVVGFAELDVGTRRAGELAGFDPNGQATIDPAVGGNYAEVWSGIGVRGSYRAGFLELGYPVLARRWDRGRPDLPAANGATSGAFAPTLTVRWQAAVGIAIPVTKTLRATGRLEWRIRYYDQRDGQELADGVIHGTQEIRPLFGLAWTP